MKEAPTLADAYIDCEECGFEWLLPSEVIEVIFNDEIFYVCQNSDCRDKLIERLTKQPQEGK